MIKNPKCLQM